MPPYMSVSAGRGKCLFNVLFFLKVKPPCDQTWWYRFNFAIDFGYLYLGDPEKPFSWPLKKFWSRVGHPLFGLMRLFLAFFEVRIKPSCDYAFTAGPDLMCPSSWALNSDDFPFFWILYCSFRTRVTAVRSLVNICWNFSQQMLTELHTAVTLVSDEQ